MKEAVGGISIFQIVIFFILLFTGVMCLTINHSKAFGVKDEIITILENSELGNAINSASFGLTSSTFQDIKDHLDEVGYRITGDCPANESGKGEWVGYTRNGTVNNKQAAFCIRANKVSSLYAEEAKLKCEDNNKCIVTEDDFPDAVYYDVVLFFQLDIPFINNLFNFKLYGSTKVIFG